MNKKLLQKIGVILMGILLSGSVGFNISGISMGGEDHQTVIQDGIAEVLAPIMREVVNDELDSFAVGINERFDDLELQSYSSDILKLTLGMADVRTTQEADDMVKFWVENKWTSQLTAIQRISEFPKAREELKNNLYSEEIFKTLMLYAR